MPLCVGYDFEAKGVTSLASADGELLDQSSKRRLEIYGRDLTALFLGPGGASCLVYGREAAEQGPAGGQPRGGLAPAPEQLQSPPESCRPHMLAFVWEGARPPSARGNPADGKASEQGTLYAPPLSLTCLGVRELKFPGRD